MLLARFAGKLEHKGYHNCSAYGTSGSSSCLSRGLDPPTAWLVGLAVHLWSTERHDRTLHQVGACSANFSTLWVVGEAVTALGRIGTDLRPTSGRVGIFLEGGQNSLVATHARFGTCDLRLTSVEGLRLQYVSIYALYRRSLLKERL